MDLQVLNKEQQRAVNLLYGPVMCIAGAGTGKTKVLTYRYANLLEHNIKPYEILTVTFTNKAANEMKERIEKLTGLTLNRSNSWISTFHSFSVKVLKAEISHLKNYSSSFKIIDEEDQKKLLKDVLIEFGGDEKDYTKNPEFKIGRIQSFISALKNGMGYSTDIPIEFFDIKDLYNKKLLSLNAMDFDDLILNVIDLFRENPDVLNHYKNKFKFIMIDEFQDTNTYQYELIKLLADTYSNIFIVGDQDQSIYSFRGARVKNIEDFMYDYPEYTMVKLERNYRSNDKILKLANTSIKNNRDRIDKNLFTETKTTVMPKLMSFSTNFKEADYIISSIEKLLHNGVKGSEIAVLYRTNALSKDLEDRLLKKHIKYKIYGGMPFYSRKEIKDMLAYIQLALDKNDNLSFNRIINVPARKIGKKALEEIENYAIDNNLPLYDATVKLSDSSSKNALSYKSFVDLMDSFSKYLDAYDMSKHLNIC